jgi:hypothetical protein
MDALASLSNAAAARAALGDLPRLYRVWVDVSRRGSAV